MKNDNAAVVMAEAYYKLKQENDILKERLREAIQLFKDYTTDFDHNDPVCQFCIYTERLLED